MKFFEEIAVPAGILASLIIGAGVFSLPFIFVRAGFALGFIYLLAFTFLAIKIHKMYAEIALNDHEARFSGHVKKYLGERAFWLANIVSILGGLFTILAYVVLSENFLKVLIPAAPGSLLTVFYWALASTIVALGVLKFAGLDFFFLVTMIAVTVAIFIFGIRNGDLSLINQSSFNLSNIILPMGPIIFALSGRAAISSIKDYYEEKRINPKFIYRAINWGTIVPALVYLLFIIGIVTLSPKGVSYDSLSGLINLPKWLMVGINLFGLIAILTSHIFLGIETKMILKNDLKLSSKTALLVVIFTPIVFYFLGITNFIAIVGIIGGIFLAIENILVVLMHETMTRKRKLIDLALIIVLAVGIVYEITKIFI